MDADTAFLNLSINEMQKILKKIRTYKSCKKILQSPNKLISNFKLVKVKRYFFLINIRIRL
jgi:hypothetical protein